MRVFAHIATIVVLLGVLGGIPLAVYGNIPKILGVATGQTDTVSAATTIQEAPSGHFTIVINRDLHTDKKVLGDWETFLSGKDAPLIMEDVSCVAMNGDSAGIEMAGQLQSRLPENQMKLQIVDPVLALSKAENGIFDILVMSDEMALAFGASSLEALPFADVIHR